MLRRPSFRTFESSIVRPNPDWSIDTVVQTFTKSELKNSALKAKLYQNTPEMNSKLHFNT